MPEIKDTELEQVNGGIRSSEQKQLESSIGEKESYYEQSYSNSNPEKFGESLDCGTNYGGFFSFFINLFGKKSRRFNKNKKNII